MNKTASEAATQWPPIDSARFHFVTQFLMTRAQKADGVMDVKQTCDDVDYAWDRIVNPRPLPQAVIVPIK